MPISKTICRIVYFCFALLCITHFESADAAFQYDQSWHWQTLESQHFKIHFRDSEKSIALKTAKISETFLLQLQPLLNWIPQDKVDIIISDKVDYAEGSVMPFLPSPRIHLYVNPPESGWFYDWFRVLIKNELTKTVHLDKAAGRPESLRKIFGNHPLLYPNVFQQAWLIEGLATFEETDSTAHTGRGQGSNFAMLMRDEVINGLRPLKQINVSSTLWPGRTIIYVYGYYFYDFLKTQYGTEKIKQLINTYSNHLIPFNINNAFIKTFNKTLPEMWLDFEAYLKTKFAPEVKRIRQQGLVTGYPLTTSGYSKFFAEPISTEDILIGAYNGETPAQLYKLNFLTGKTSLVHKIWPDSRVDYSAKQGILINSMEIFRNTNFYYDLYRINKNERRLHRLSRGQRLRRSIWSPDGKHIISVYSNLGHHSLILLDQEGNIQDILWEGKENELISGLDWSPDGKSLVASKKKGTATWNLQEFSLKDKKWTALTNNNFTERDPQFSPDGKYVLYSADYDGVFNIYRLDKKTGKIDKLTNVLGGAFQPKLNSRGNLVYLNTSSKGYDVYLLEQVVSLKHLTVSQFQPARHLKVEYPDIPFEIHPYNPISQLTPRWWEPRFVLDNGDKRLGMYTSGSDALNRHNYDLFAEWDVKAQASSAALNYSYDRWFPLLQAKASSINHYNFTHQGFLLEALVPFLSRQNRWFLSASTSYEDDNTIRYDKNNNQIDIDYQSRLVGLAALWDTRQTYVRSFQPTTGRTVKVVYETTGLTNSNNPGQMLTTDWREQLQLKNSLAFAFRLTSGLGIGNPRPFQLGGSFSDVGMFQHNIFTNVAYRANYYNKRRYALRGYSATDDALRGRRMLMLNMEWHIPGNYVERAFPVFPLGLRKLSSTVFYNTASVWNTGLQPQHFYQGVGLEFIADTEWFTYFKLRLRLGFASGFGDHGTRQIYLLGGSSF